MGMNIKRFLGLNSFNEDENGREFTHKEKFSAIVRAIGLEECIQWIPFSKDEIEEALELDEYLNTLPIREWERMHPSFVYCFQRIGINTVSQSDTICTLKQAARMWVEE